ncbi:MAG: metallophosphoesterase, partial [Clostridia bacterium]|nr:metallophosphoesterase [Clostridia bacterium]
SEKLTSRLIEELQKQKPNIIVFTGDLIDSYKTDIDTAINLIKEIKDIAPIYYVPGNHESRISDYSKLITEMKNHDAVILDNKVEVLELKGAKLNLLGIDDPSMAHGLYLSDREIVKTELNNLNYDKNNYSILLSHRPELFDMYAANKIDLVMTGHAHGGQIRVPFIGGLFAPNQGFFPKYTSGTFKEDKTTMIVSRGIGNSIMPFRINNRPELVVIELKNK